MEPVGSEAPAATGTEDAGTLPDRAARAVTALRVLAALLLVAHGVARAGLGIVDDFGTFLDARGFPFGSTLAWSVTAFEVVGGSVLAFGRLVRPIAILFMVQLAVGIGLVHAPEGWFVVGAGRNGVEYSVLLIAVFGAVAYVGEPRRS